MRKWLEYFLSGIGGTGIFGLIAYGLGWIRFKKSDQAKVDKVRAETAVDLAAVNAKHIDDEVKISKAALEWTIQLAGQLEKANMLNEKKQADNDALRSAMQQMKEDFEKRMSVMEDLLEQNQRELAEEKKKNSELLVRLNNYIDGGKK